MSEQVKLVWITPDAEKLVAYMARVSNPENQDNPDSKKLISYLIKHKHFSPFEMVNACFEINTTRDIGRQILRHRSFTFQEFCISGNSMITLELPSGMKNGKRSAYKRSIEHLYHLQESGKKLPTYARVYDEDSKTFICAGIKEVFKTGVKPLFKVTLENGKSIESTKDHKFFTNDGWSTLEDAVGLSMNGKTAAMSKKDVFFATNGVETYKSKEWMSNAKQECIKNGTGVQGIADASGYSYHTIRKWLRVHGIQFTKQETMSYTDIWNKGKHGYSWGKHSIETIEKMRKSAKKGSDSNLWKGGADRSERLKIADWCNSIRAEKLIEYSHKCNRCESSKNLELHHMKTVATNPELAYDKDNIEVLCKECHSEHHSLNGDRKGWREKSIGNTLTTGYSKVKSIEYIGEHMTYDMEIDHKSHNYVANGIVTHNSGRYQSYDKLDSAPLRECRMQDVKNRQNSIEALDEDLIDEWDNLQASVGNMAFAAYEQALASGIAKEQARALLPEGLTPSRMYMNGTLRSWMHYIDLRADKATQKEHRQIAEQVQSILYDAVPMIMNAMEESK